MHGEPGNEARMWGRVIWISPRALVTRQLPAQGH